MRFLDMVRRTKLSWACSGVMWLAIGVIGSACSSTSSNAAGSDAGPGADAEGGVVSTTDGFAWAKSFASGSGSQIIAMAADASGVVIAGQIEGTATFGSTTLTASGGSGSAFVAKLDASGNVLWAKGTSGASGDFEGLALDPAGNIYVSGIDTGDKTTITLGSTTLTNGMIEGQTSQGGGTLFKLDAGGNVLWGKLAPTTGEINIASLAVVGDTVFAAGPIIDDASLASDGSNPITGCAKAGCVFLAAFDGSGALKWAKQAPSSPHRGTGIDPGEVWLAANSKALTLAIGGSFSSAGGGSPDTQELVVSQYDLTGALTWTKVTPAQDSPKVSGVALDATGNAYVLGESVGIALGGVNIAGSEGGSAAFIAKYSPTGDVAWATGSNIGDKVSKSLATRSIASSDRIYLFGNGGESSGGPVSMVVDVIDPATGALVSEIPCSAAMALGNAVTASTAGVYVGGYGGPPSKFGMQTTTDLGLFVAKLR